MVTQKVRRQANVKIHSKTGQEREEGDNGTLDQYPAEFQAPD